MKINVAVLFGGKSTEHDVSIISALQTMENLDKEKYEITPIYISKDGDFYTSNDSFLFDSKNYKDKSALFSHCENVTFVKIKDKTYIRSVETKLFKKGIDKLIDVAFPVVHGTNVEDGNLQGFIRTLNLPLVGPDTLSSALSMDKYVMKEYCKAIDIPVIDALRFDKNNFLKVNDIIKSVENKIGYPVIVKPVNLGSSIGIKKASDKVELKDALSYAFTFASIVLVEKAITNLREINCAVIGDKFDCGVGVLEEPFGKDEILSFQDKYLSGGKGTKGTKLELDSLKSGQKSGMASLKRKIPADIDDNTAELIRGYAKRIFKYIGCSGVARIDFIIDKDTRKIYANEINSIPGSLAYYLFEPMGLKFKDLLDKLIKIALDNYREEKKLNYTFESSII